MLLYFLTLHSGANVTHTFVVKPSETGVFHIPAARVKYQEMKDTPTVGI